MSVNGSGGGKVTGARGSAEFGALTGAGGLSAARTGVSPTMVGSPCFSSLPGGVGDGSGGALVNSDEPPLTSDGGIGSGSCGNKVLLDKGEAGERDGALGSIPSSISCPVCGSPSCPDCDPFFSGAGGFSGFDDADASRGLSNGWASSFPVFSEADGFSGLGDANASRGFSNGWASSFPIFAGSSGNSIVDDAEARSWLPVGSVLSLFRSLSLSLSLSLPLSLFWSASFPLSFGGKGGIGSEVESSARVGDGFFAVLAVVTAGESEPAPATDAGGREDWPGILRLGGAFSPFAG